MGFFSCFMMMNDNDLELVQKITKRYKIMSVIEAWERVIIFMPFFISAVMVYRLI